MARGHQPLVNAIRAGDLAGLKQAIARDSAAARHWKPIVDAAFSGRADMVRLLIEKGADPNVISGTGSRHTPMTRVCQYHATIPRTAGHVEVLSVLLEAGADARLAAGPLGVAPLAYAAIGPHEAMVNLLRDEVGELDIHMAAVLLEQVRIDDLLGLDSGLADAEDSRGRRPLDYVAWSGYWRTLDCDSIGCAKTLLAAGAAADEGEKIVEHGEEFDATPLWRTLSYQQNLALAELLLERGANPDNAVFAVTYGGSLEACELLDRFGADWNHRFEGRTPLMDLMAFRKPAGSTWLLDRGVDVLAKDDAGKTALHHAAAQGVRADYIERLLEAGADPSAKDDDGKTALDYAVEKKRTRLIDLLGEPR